MATLQSSGFSFHIDIYEINKEHIFFESNVRYKNNPIFNLHLFTEDSWTNNRKKMDSVKSEELDNFSLVRLIDKLLKNELDFLEWSPLDPDIILNINPSTVIKDLYEITIKYDFQSINRDTEGYYDDSSLGISFHTNKEDLKKFNKELKKEINNAKIEKLNLYKKVTKEEVNEFISFSKNKNYFGLVDKISWENSKNDLKLIKKYRKQFLKKGFDDTSLFNLDYTFSYIIYTRLEDFKKGLQGTPSTVDSFEEWKTIINQMIEGFKIYCDSDTTDLYVKSENGSYVDSEIMIKFKKSKELFSKWLEHLWT